MRNADSLGMNEIEMKMLLDYWKGDLHDINEVSILNLYYNSIIIMNYLYND